MDADEIAFQAQLRETFLEEAVALLDDFEQNLLALERSTNRADNLARIFRAAHSLKGSSASVGFHSLAAFAHTTEDCLAVLRGRPELVTSEVISVLLEGLDLLRAMAAGLRQYGSNFKDPAATQTLASRIQGWTNRLQGSDATPDIGQVLVGSGLASMAAVEAAATRQQALRAKRLGEIMVEDGTLKPDSLQKAVEIQQNRRQPAAANNAKVTSFLKIDASRVDAVMDLVGELVVIKSQLAQHALASESESPSSGLLSLLDKTVRDLYERALAMRMMTLKPAFMKLERTVRDVSLKVSKPVIFTTTGDDTELDRALIEQLGDPLVHLCRNAIDHGIEAAPIRAAAGKPTSGSLTVSARRRGSSIILEVTDDGGGINRDAVQRKAIERGVVASQEAAAAMSDMDIYALLFEPGFSTAAKVTDVSGRGVGLDVVKSNIEAMKGQVEIESRSELGTTFRLVLPLTTAITDGMIVSSGGRRYVLPVEYIAEFVQLTPEMVTELDDGASVIEVRGQFLPLVRLGNVLHGPASSGRLVVVAETMGRKVGVLVDEVLGQGQVVLKPLSDDLEASPGVAGAAILGDGKVALVLDLPSLLAT